MSRAEGSGAARTPERPRVIGLVGGIGSGKSAAREILAGLGAEAIDADRLGHAVYEPGTPGFEAVVAAFGREVVGEDGRIDRRRLGRIVFSEPARLAELNRIVHPLIRAELERRLGDARRRGRAPAVVIEAAVLLEAGWDSLVDEIWAVVADRDRVFERLARQRGLSRAEVEERLARQMSDRERRERADVVIENVGTLDDLRRRLEEAWRARIVH